MRSSLLLCLLFVGCKSFHEPASQPGTAPDSAPAAVDAPVRRVLMASGTVTIDQAPALAGKEFGENSVIQTGGDGHAVVTLGGGSVVDVGANANLKLGTSTRKRTSVQLLSGTLLSALTSGSSYEVVTSTAVAGVRGTRFFVEASSATQTYVCACSGDVQLTAVDGKSFDQLVSSPHQEHHGFTLALADNKPQATPASQHNHGAVQDAAIEAGLKLVQVAK